MRNVRLLLWLIVFVVASGCDYGGTLGTESARLGGENYTLTEDAEPVDVNEVSVAEQTDSTIVFQSSGPGLDIEEGDVLFSKVEPSEVEDAPRFLRKAKAVQRQGEQIRVETERAALVEAVREASLQFSASLDSANTVQSSKMVGRGNWKVTSTAEGVTVRSCQDVQLSDVALPTGNNIQVALENGRVSFCPDIDGNISVTTSGFATPTVDTFRAVGSGELTYDTDVVAAASASLENEGDMELTTFKTIGVVGPVVYEVKVSLVAGFMASAEGDTGMNTGVESGGFVEMGGSYVNGTWSAISDQGVNFDSREVEWGREAGATVRGYVKPEIETELWYSVAASMFTGPYVELSAKKSEDLVKDYEYGAYGGLDGGVEFDLNVLAFDIAMYEKTIFDLRTRIAGVGPTNPPPNSPRSPQPSDEGVASGTSPTLMWEASDPDNDDLTYKVRLGTSSSPSQVASGLSSATYDSEGLASGTTYYWQVVVTDQDGASTEGPVWSFATPSEPTGTLRGRVTDAVTDAPIEDVNVDVQRSGDVVRSTGTDGDGQFVVSVPTGEGYTAAFEKEGYLPEQYRNITIRNGQETALEPVLQVDEDDDGTGTVRGRIVDATTGDPIPGASVELREGINTTQGSVVASAETDAEGTYQFDALQAGNYTAEASEQGYSTSSFTVTAIGGQTNEIPDATLSPTQEEGNYRIVLTWGETPEDLDSHLTYPDPGGDGRFHLYWERLPRWGGSNPYPEYAELDRDDITSFGPETITIYQLVDGVYRYSVHDFVNREATQSVALGNSGAQVEVYRGDSLLRTFNVPSGEEGTLWTVFEIRNGEIEPVNNMTYESNPADVKSGERKVDISLFRNLPSKQ